MPVTRFPEPQTANEDDIVAIGGDLHPETLLLAYRQGIFPWPMPGWPLAWFCPAERAILEWSQLHLSRSLKRWKKNHPYYLTVNRAFREVISQCAKLPRPNQDGTWITSEVIEGYTQLFQLGYAHSVEVWRERSLVGGVYGVCVNHYFSAESMFHLETNTSKLALLFLMETLHAKGIEWIDIQVMTPHMEALGARLIKRDDFLKMIS